MWPHVGTGVYILRYPSVVTRVYFGWFYFTFHTEEKTLENRIRSKNVFLKVRYGPFFSEGGGDRK